MSLEGQRAIETLPEGVRPTIQTDNGSGNVSPEFKEVLTESPVGHIRIKPDCPEGNGLAEAPDRLEVENFQRARKFIAQIVRWCNEERLHSTSQFLRPADYYRGERERCPQERRRTLADAGH